jgi:ABC-type phosphate transport system substrate-binding protein
VRKWLLAGAALLLAAAVAISGLIVTHFGSHKSSSMRGAIFLACGPIPLGPNFFWQSQPHGGYLDADGSTTLTVRRTDKPWSQVVVKQTSDGKVTVEDCNSFMGVHG